MGQHHIGYRDLVILALAPLVARHDFLLLHITATLQFSLLSLRCHMLSFRCLAEQPCDIQLQLGECRESDATNSRTPPLAEVSYVPPRGGAADAGPSRVGGTWKVPWPFPESHLQIGWRCKNALSLRLSVPRRFLPRMDNADR